MFHRANHDMNPDRRRFLGTAAMALAASRLGLIGFANAPIMNTRPVQPVTKKKAPHASFGPLKQIEAGVLNVGYAEDGPGDGPVVILLHGWPYDIHSYVDVAPLLAAKGYRVIVPYLRGYGTTRFLSPETFRNAQYYFATERGERGYGENRREFNKLIWKNASPKWDFDDATFNRTAASFDNADHVSIVIHNYRWRLDLAKGEPRYDQFEQKLFQAPVITVPTITIASDFDGAAADGKSYAGKFSGKYSHRVLDGIGHNVPQEAPQAFAQAVIDVDGF